jgi:oligopeptide transport system substrate-binding protein
LEARLAASLALVSVRLYRTLFGILAVFACALVIVGFTFGKSSDRRADFVLANETEPKSLDPATMTGEPEGRLAMALFEGVTRYDAKTMLPAPGVAESWDISEDGKTYTFHLRAGARWTDGRPVTASDFVYSWKRLLAPKTASEYAYIAFPIRFAEAYSTYDGLADSIESKIVPALVGLGQKNPNGVPAKAWQAFLSEGHVHDPLRAESDPGIQALLSRRSGTVSAAELALFRDALERAHTRLQSDAREARAHLGIDAGFIARDERTLVVELRAPTPYFLDVLTFHSMMPTPRWVVETHPEDWFLPEHFVGNGPFRMTRWVVNDRIRLERSETYWGKNEVRLSTVDLLSIESDTANLNLYLTGDSDYLPKNYPRDLAPILKHRADFHATPSNVVYFYRFNTTRKPFDDRRVRHAISIAFDRETIVKNVTGVGERAAYTLVPPVLTDYESPPTVLRYDVKEARALLAEAGYPGGKGFPKIGILYNTQEGHKKIADVISDELRQNLGIEVQSYNQEWQSYLATERNLDYDMSRGGWIGDYPDPNTFLDLWVTNGGNNRTGWGFARYDELVRLAGDVEPLIRDPEPVLKGFGEPEPVRGLLDQLRSAPTPAARLALRAKIRLRVLREAEAILVQEEFPILPVYFYVNSGFTRENVRGFYQQLVFDDGRTGWNFQDIHPLRDIWIESPRKGGGW